jgi:hypothetical protein
MKPAQKLYRGAVFCGKALVSLGLAFGTAFGLPTPAPRQPPISSRVSAVRVELSKRALDLPHISDQNSQPPEIAQWGNWVNWANWNNWGNWANWGNWFNT